MTGKSRNIQVDTGFIVFNEQNYPNFVRLLNQLGVEFQDTRMGFSVRSEQLGLEYGRGILSGPVRSPPKPDRLAPLENGFGHHALSQTSRGEGQSESNGRSIFENPRVRKSFQGMLPPSLGSLWSCSTTRFGEFPMEFVTSFWKTTICSKWPIGPYSEYSREVPAPRRQNRLPTETASGLMRSQESNAYRG